MSRLTSNMRIMDENSLVARFRGKEDAAVAKTPGVKKKALADVANTINQKAGKNYTPKKGGIQFPLKKGQFAVFEKSDKTLDSTPLNKSSKSLLERTKKKFNTDENVLSGKDSVKQFCDTTGKHVKLTKALGAVTKGISYLEVSNKGGNVDEFNAKKDNKEEQKPASVATVICVDELEEEPVEEYGCTRCSQPVEDDYYDILPEYLLLTPEQIIESAMCWEPKPKVMEKKTFNMPLLPELPVYDVEDPLELGDILLTV